MKRIEPSAGSDDQFCPQCRRFSTWLEGGWDFFLSQSEELKLTPFIEWKQTTGDACVIEARVHGNDRRRRPWRLFCGDPVLSTLGQHVWLVGGLARSKSIDSKSSRLLVFLKRRGADFLQHNPTRVMICRIHWYLTLLILVSEDMPHTGSAVVREAWSELEMITKQQLIQTNGSARRRQRILAVVKELEDISQDPDSTEEERNALCSIIARLEMLFRDTNDSREPLFESLLSYTLADDTGV